MDKFINPVGAGFTGKQPMKTVDKLSYLNSLEGFVRYSADHTIGTYYPVRTLPSLSIDDDSETPIVMCPGTIVSVIPIRDARAYTEADTNAGIRATGLQYVSMGVDGVALSKSIDYMYDKEVSGLIVPANGGSETNDSYTNDCGTYGILTLSGEVAASTSTAYVRAANTPMGIVLSNVYADIRERWLNYEPRQANQGHAVSRAGTLTIPYVGIYGSGDRAAVLAQIRTALNDKHIYAWFSETSLANVNARIATNAYLQPDAYGKFTYSASADAQRFAKVLETRNRVPQNIDEIIDSFPGSGMKGTDTAGLRAREYDFVKKILSCSTVAPSAGYANTKSNITQMFYTPLVTATSNVSIVIGRFDIAYGLYA
jgi:hypothetical protein